jgi:NADPH:quinone reductase-like Zn-dependent oxidoreductase
MAIPETMKAYLLTGFGGYENLSYREDIAVPFPESNEVLIKVEACGVNNTDIWTRLGSYGGSFDDSNQSQTSWAV